MSDNQSQTKSTDPLPTNEVDSEVWVTLKIPGTDQGLGPSRTMGDDLQGEPFAYHKWVEGSNPGYRQDYESKGWQPISSDLLGFAFMDWMAVPGSLNETHEWRVNARSRPQDAWKIFYQTPYVFRNRNSGIYEKILASSPIYPGRVHRTFLANSGFTYIKVEKYLPQEHERFEWSGAFQFLRANGEQDRGVINNNDRVVMEIMHMKEEDDRFPGSGLNPAKYKSRGFVAAQKDSTGRFDFTDTVGSEDYTNQHRLDAIEFEIHLAWPPNHHPGDGDDGSEAKKQD